MAAELDELPSEAVHFFFGSRVIRVASEEGQLET